MVEANFTTSKDKETVPFFFHSDNGNTTLTKKKKCSDMNNYPICTEKFSHYVTYAKRKGLDVPTCTDVPSEQS